MKSYFVYIISSKHFTTFYTGYTDDLRKRLLEHKTKFYEKSFSARYNLGILLYYEEFGYESDARRREYLIKKWPRAWKENLIKSKNPKYVDLGKDWYSENDFKDIHRLSKLY